MGEHYLLLADNEQQPLNNVYCFLETIFEKENIGTSHYTTISLAQDLATIAKNIKDKTKEIEQKGRKPILIVDAHLLVADDSFLSYEGIQLLKYLRIQHHLHHSIFILGFEELKTVLRRHPEHYILMAPGNSYIQLPCTRETFLPYVYNHQPIENNKLREYYKPFVKSDFDISQFGHSFANEFGLSLMHLANGDISENNGVEPPNELEFSKARLIYNYGKDDQYLEVAKNQLETLRKLISENECTIYCIDDQGEDGWYNLYQKLCFIKPNIRFKSLENNILKKEDYIQEIRKKITSSKPDVVLLDLRLKGDEENQTPIHDISGYKVLKKLHQKFPALPIIISSATNKSDNLTKLKNAGAFALWSKPRIEQGNIDIYQKHLELTSILYEALNNYDHETEKWILEADYHIQRLLELKQDFIHFVDEFLNDLIKKLEHELESDEKVLLPLFVADKIILDSNFFIRTKRKEDFINCYLLLWGICMYNHSKDRKRNVIVVKDITDELMINSINRSNCRETRLVSKYAVETLMKIEQKWPYIIENEHYKITNNLEDIVVGKGKKVEENKVYIEKRLKRYIDVVSNSDFEKRRKKHEVKIKGKNWTHADEVIRMLIRYYFNNGEVSRVQVINEDKGCKESICNILKAENGFGSEVYKEEKIGFHIENNNQRCDFSDVETMRKAFQTKIMEPFFQNK